ncbi:MAG TPA: tRNA uracil 4-sulfurtransferase ThiI [Actinomycetota bacterium]
MARREHVVVHYDEIGLKGRNRSHFERALIDNLVRAASDVAPLVPRRLPGRMLVAVPDGVRAADLAERLGEVYGVANCAAAVGGRLDFDGLCAIAGEAMEGAYETFAVRARVAHSDFPLSAREINEKLGAWLLERHGRRVNLDHPDRTCHVEVVGDLVLVYVERVAGLGGLPVGTSGRVSVLLSAGIDSPVAAARMMRRGAHCDFVHFHSQPFTDASSVRNATELVERLTRRQYESVLHLAPLAPAQQEIVASCPEPLRTILYRRMMMRIAAALAERDGARALVTGDALGQVASQTLENLACVEDASPIPVLRPLIGLDKLEIIGQARALGTFEVSSAPCQEACVLFEPKGPVTKGRIQDMQRAESALDVRALVQEAVSNTETKRLTWPDAPVP